MNQDSLLKRAVICVIVASAASIGETAISQDSDQAADALKTATYLEAIDEVFGVMVKDGYSRAEGFIAARIEEFEAAKRMQLNELKTELINTEQAESGKGKPFKNAREKAVRREELRLRIAKLESSQPNPVTVKWIPGEQDFNPAERSLAIRPGGIYSIASLEVAQITGSDEFHGYFRILPPNPKPAAEIAWRNPKSDSAKRWLQLQRCVVWCPGGTDSLKVGEEILTERSLFLCTDILSYETTSGTNTIPIVTSLEAKWKKYLKENIPEGSLSIITPKPIPAAPLPNREWKDTTGKFNIEAVLLSSNDLTVELKKKDGTNITVRKSTLCLQDNLYIEAAKLMEVPFVSRWKNRDTADY